MDSKTIENNDNPRVYVGTYAKYNDGNLDGEWVDLTDFSTYDEFLDYIHDLHKDEKDPEFMFQDFENFPEKWYSESGIDEETFNKILAYSELIGSYRQAYKTYVGLGFEDDSIEAFQDAYAGEFDSKNDFAHSIVDNIGWDGIGEDNLYSYFDYEDFGRDLTFEMHQGDDETEDAEGGVESSDNYYDSDGYVTYPYSDNDSEVAIDYIDGIGGVEKLQKDILVTYFDYDKFAQDLLVNDYIEEDGYYFNRY